MTNTVQLVTTIVQVAAMIKDPTDVIRLAKALTNGTQLNTSAF